MVNIRKIKISFHAHNITDYRINKALLQVKNKHTNKQTSSKRDLAPGLYSLWTSSLGNMCAMCSVALDSLQPYGL